MPNIIFNIPLYYRHCHLYIYTELAPNLTATTSVVELVERWSRYPGSLFDSQPEGLDLHFS